MLWDLNPIAIIVAAIVSFILGALWYSPWAFGRKWADTLGLSYEGMKPDVKQYVGAAVIALVTALVMGFLVSWLRIFSVGEGIKLGFLVWLGFLATSQFSGVLWVNKPLNAYFIDAGFWLVNLIIMGAIIAPW